MKKTSEHLILNSRSLITQELFVQITLEVSTFPLNSDVFNVYYSAVKKIAVNLKPGIKTFFLNSSKVKTVYYIT